jgi:hypothetical protein
MSSVLSKSVPPSTVPPATPPTNPNSAQLKKLLASPKRDQLEAPPISKAHHSPPSLDSSRPNDPDDFMNQLSQNTVSFHASTHSGGRPISPSLQRFSASPSPVEDTSKTRALTQALSLNSNSASTAAAIASGKKASPPSAAPITGIALSQHSNGKKSHGASSSADPFPTDREIGAKSMSRHGPGGSTHTLATDLENGKIDSSALLAPSDLTGCPFSFPI